MPKMTIVLSKKKPDMAKPEGMMCPKCGAELKDTPENRKYMKMREDEAAEDEYEDEDED